MSIRTMLGSFALVAALALPAFAQAGTATPPSKGEDCACPHGQMGDKMGMGKGHAGHGDVHRMHGAAMASCHQLEGLVDMTVQNTAQGATLQMQARDPSQTRQVQQLAQQCLTARQEMQQQMQRMGGQTGQQQPGQGR